MILLLDIGNTNTHVGLANSSRLIRRSEFPTGLWRKGPPPALLSEILGKRAVDAVAFCSVVPGVIPAVRGFIKSRGYDAAELTWKSLSGMKLKYARPDTLGTDRLARVFAATRDYGYPVVCVGFGTAVTIDAVDRQGRFIGGIIAPGIGAFRDYLHEKTALLPEIKLRTASRLIGRNTEEAMRIGCVSGFQGMMDSLIRGALDELGAPDAPVVATGGYAQLAAKWLPRITVVHRDLTLEGLRRFWLERAQGSHD